MVHTTREVTWLPYVVVNTLHRDDRSALYIMNPTTSIPEGRIVMIVVKCKTLINLTTEISTSILSFNLIDWVSILSMLLQKDIKLITASWKELTIVAEF